MLNTTTSNKYNKYTLHDIKYINNTQSVIRMFKVCIAEKQSR